MQIKSLTFLSFEKRVSILVQILVARITRSFPVYNPFPVKQKCFFHKILFELNCLPKTSPVRQTVFTKKPEVCFEQCGIGHLSSWVAAGGL